jgi:hypothetical protein
MDVLNMNPHAMPVKLKTPDGKADYATVAARRRVTLPAGHTVDINWLAQQSKIKTYDSSNSKTPLVLPQASVLPIPVPAPVPVTDTNVKAD